MAKGLLASLEVLAFSHPLAVRTLPSPNSRSTSFHETKLQTALCCLTGRKLGHPRKLELPAALPLPFEVGARVGERAGEPCAGEIAA